MSWETGSDIESDCDPDSDSDTDNAFTAALSGSLYPPVMIGMGAIGADKAFSGVIWPEQLPVIVDLLTIPDLR
jgi:hypothetical protein